jgi:hypothetical protein
VFRCDRKQRMFHSSIEGRLTKKAGKIKINSSHTSRPFIAHF